MAETVNDTIRELLDSTLETMQALLEASDPELPMPSSHVCAQGKDAWALITNDIDHEIIHSGQVHEGRYEARITQSPMARLIAEWFEERSRFIGPRRPQRRRVQFRDRGRRMDLSRRRQARPAR